MPKLLISVAVAASLSGCAAWRQPVEMFATAAVKDQQAVDDDAAKAISIAPQAITAGAMARFPSGRARCDLAELAGLQLVGCGAALTASDVQTIVDQQLTVHFGPAPGASAPATTSSPVALPATPKPTTSNVQTNFPASVQMQARAAAEQMQVLMQGQLAK